MRFFIGQRWRINDRYIAALDDQSDPIVTVTDVLPSDIAVTDRIDDQLDVPVYLFESWIDDQLITLVQQSPIGKRGINRYGKSNRRFFWDRIVDTFDRSVIVRWILVIRSENGTRYTYSVAATSADITYSHLAAFRLKLARQILKQKVSETNKGEQNE